MSIIIKMRKWLSGAICTLAISACSGFGMGKDTTIKPKQYEIKYEKRSKGFYATKNTKEGYNLKLWMENQKVTAHLIHLENKNDYLGFEDDDFDNNNGIERIMNLSKNEKCEKSNSFNKVCTKEQLKKGNELFKYVLKELEFEKYRKKRGKIDIFGGW